MSRKNLSLIVGAASLTTAAALWGSAAIAQPTLTAPVPDPQPAKLALVTRPLSVDRRGDV
jgi:hypothetical protein